MVGSECTLEPAPFPTMSSTLGEVLILGDKRCLSSMNGNLAEAALFPGGVFVSGNKRNKEADIIHCRHVPLAHANLSVLNPSLQQHGIRLVDKLASCSGWSQP